MAANRAEQVTVKLICTPAFGIFQPEINTKRLASLYVSDR
ncbi:MAG: hypothetical protein ACI87Q_000844 [Pseudohongiellaceae bacterium]|jgi:hypothetical protein